MKTIVHTTDLAHDDAVAFEHSIALARAARARLVALHANAPAAAVEQIPDADRVLAAWGQPPNAIEFTKRVHNCCDEPVDTILDAIREISPDLVVAATHRRSTLTRFFTGSHAEAIAHNVTAPTLLMPADTRGFVARDDGTIDLHRVLIPIGDAQEAWAALSAAAWLVELSGIAATEFLLLHVGGPVEIQTGVLEQHPGWTVRHANVEHGDVEAAIVEQARDACLIVMATRGHDSVGDVLLGSHTDRVLHRTRCPILSVAV